MNFLKAPKKVWGFFKSPIQSTKSVIRNWRATRQLNRRTEELLTHQQRVNRAKELFNKSTYHTSSKLEKQAIQKDTKELMDIMKKDERIKAYVLKQMEANSQQSQSRSQEQSM